MGSFIYILSTIVDLCFAVYNLEFFSSNTGKVQFEVLVHLLKYIRDKNNLGLKYNSKIEDATLYDLLRQSIIETENQFMVFSDSIYKDFPDTGISTGAYIVFYQCGKIDHCTHVPGAVSQYSAEIKYNLAFTALMDLAHFRMLNNEFSNKNPDVVP